MGCYVTKNISSNMDQSGNVLLYVARDKHTHHMIHHGLIIIYKLIMSYRIVIVVTNSVARRKNHYQKK